MSNKPDEQRIEEFVMMAKLLETPPDLNNPVVSELFLGMALNSMRLELEGDGLLEAAANRLADVSAPVPETGDGGEHNNPGHGEGG